MRGAYVGDPAAAEAGVGVDVGFGHLLAEPAGTEEVLEEGGVLVAGPLAPGEHHGPRLHHAREVGHEPQNLGAGGEELGVRWV